MLEHLHGISGCDLSGSEAICQSVRDLYPGILSCSDCSIQLRSHLIDGLPQTCPLHLSGSHLPGCHLVGRKSACHVLCYLIRQIESLCPLFSHISKELRSIVLGHCDKHMMPRISSIGPHALQCVYQIRTELITILGNDCCHFILVLLDPFGLALKI